VSQECHKGVARVVQERERGGHVRRHKMYRVALARHDELQGCYKDVRESVTRVLKECYKIVTRVLEKVLQEHCKGALRVLQGCYRGVTRVLQECYKRITRLLQDCYKVYRVALA
jgi:hypothetical protein